MLARRIIPCLDIKAGRVVKGTSFVSLRDAGDPLELAQRYNEQSADELVFLDITASNENRGTTIELATRLARELFIPFTIGGGISTLDDIHALVTAGADKVSVNSSAISNPNLITEGAKRFGSQCIVVAIDARKRDLSRQDQHADDISKWEVFSHGGSRPTGLDAVAWAREMASRGAGEILLTSMDADGHQDGFELELTAAISGTLNIPVIASGGGGTFEHFRDALTIGKADAVLAASVFHYGKYTVSQVKEYLSEHSIPVRKV
ncbi:MAG: imidazole glycerol phosphate synthase subunit HisF [Deltaproteobacteria bacterium]|jgi:cyclase|nr:imidazole glycerol phosphate synthase subunit HisF [Deltaproteobacteria bacterium]MDP6308659.1 imidazole glycerol phosphate synthase subunit HisF [SAR324 cluster bacterium]MDP6487465.1 imidazole glycerol phosphate synthase subunit HisF [SAR324 cluster bacterium]MDP7170310.1 imidazole glycerol phosphate synthase subunit HisF [SAR324 cluster bacterium]MDP7175185.1 imidazole glycerol phosphate synthase subunit HisF [SAR324 cluster bacterium]|tara:strand:+ start:1651 stop:2442 length:792 start_codon:yes stop_codon:yes gene_type:complete